MCRPGLGKKKEGEHAPVVKPQKHHLGRFAKKEEGGGREKPPGSRGGRKGGEEGIQKHSWYREKKRGKGIRSGKEGRKKEGGGESTAPLVRPGSLDL